MARVLVVDGDADVVRAAVLLLETCGHVVAIEHDSAKVLAQIQSTNPDLVVFHALLPEFSDDGFGLSREVRARFPFLPILVITSPNKYSSSRTRLRQRETPLSPDLILERPLGKELLASLTGFLTSAEAPRP